MITAFVAILLVAAGVAVDQYSKHFFLAHPEYMQDVFSFLSFHFVQNTGIAFGIPVPQNILLVIITIVLIIVCGWLIKGVKRKNAHTILASLLILGGASSNLYDRITQGFVVDYIDLSWFTVFNFADVMISLGVLILFLNELREVKAKKQANNSTPAA